MAAQDRDMTTTAALSTDRTDLLGILAKHRGLFLRTVQGLTDEQAAATPTASELCLGGLVKHVTRVESRWLDFIERGPEAMAMTPESYAEHAATFRMAPGETLAEVVERYEEATRRTDEVVATVDLDASQPLPEAPWFEPGARWTARRVLMHIVAETAQHAGHADILRETIDGQKSMG
jgi:uncharacterized damage-inducible protein DinB